MAWITPKTNWVASDFFEVADYNRIKNNIQHLRDFSLNAYVEYEIEDMGRNKSEEDFYYADEFNRIEQNLERVCRNTYPFSIGESKVFSSNMPFIDFEELNRIESATSYIFEMLKGQTSGMNRLSFVLGRKPLGNRGL